MIVYFVYRYLDSLRSLDMTEKCSTDRVLVISTDRVLVISTDRALVISTDRREWRNLKVLPECLTASL